MKNFIASALCLASFSVFASGPIVENVEGCLGTQILKEGSKKKEKIVFESKAVIFRSNLEYQRAAHRYVSDKYDLGHVVALTGTRHNGYQGQHGQGLNKMRLDDGLGSLMVKLDVPENYLFIATQSTEMVSVSQSADGRVSGTIHRAPFAGGIFELDTCSDDPEVVKTWIQEVSKFSPF